MTKQTRTILKGYFETGDIPTQQQYQDLIDSFVSLDDTTVNPQIINTNFSASGFISTKTHITASGNISASGNLITSGHITASGNISASGLLGIETTHITASGVVSASGGFIGAVESSEQTNITSVGTLTSLTVSGDITAQGNIVGDDSTNITNLDTVNCDFVKADADASTLINLATDTITFAGGGANSLIITSKKIDILTPATASICSSSLLIGTNVSSSGTISASLGFFTEGTITAEQITSTDDITATGTITGEQITSTDDITAAGTVQAEHLHSTDDAVISDDLTVGGTLKVSDINTIDTFNLQFSALPTSDPGVEGQLWKLQDPVSKKYQVMISG